VNYNISKLPPSTLAGFSSPALTTANDHIISYLSSACGIKEPTIPTSSVTP
jgi:hypothetical protein